MVNVRAPSGAGLKLLFPPWDAVIVQLPAAVRVTVLPETVQLPVAAKLTARPEEAVAVTVNGGSLAVFSPSGLNVIVQDPAAVIVTVVPDAVQVPLALKVTARPVDAVAPTVKFASP